MLPVLFFFSFIFPCSGLGISNPHFPSALSRPAAADILYGYTKRDQIDSMSYPAIDVGIKYFYDALKLLTIMKANKSGNNLFREFLRYDKVGDILWQQSTQGSDPPITQDYIYDRARRLIQWNHALGLAPPATEEYLYDRVGNRRQKNLSSGIWASYAYAPVSTGPDRLMSLYEGAAIDRYAYTADGAMKKREHYLVIGLIQALQKQEAFEYSYNGLLNKYTSLTSGGAAWDWRYRYSPSGEREQKRTYEVPIAIVPVPGDGVKGWEYMLLGSDNKQHAVYKGIDASNQCGNSGRWVYFYPVEYNCFGSGSIHNITIRPYDQYNGTKEFAVVDHLGSVRATIDENGTVLNTQDYAPFGGMIANTEAPRKGFIDKEKDKESGDHNFGVRQYSPVDGRFLQVDPAAEKFYSSSPYVYCMNNPLVLVDPNGDVPYTFIVRSFHPDATFGLGYDGDNRGFSSNFAANSRVQQYMTLETGSGSLTGESKPGKSFHPLLGTGYAQISESYSTVDKALTMSGTEFSFSSEYAAHNPLISSPDIDVQSSFSLFEDTKNGLLTVSTSIKGDGFPSAEALISDSKQQTIFLGVSGYAGNPYISLWGKGEKGMIKSNFQIMTDKKGNFTGVKFKGNVYSIDDWNKQFTSKSTSK